MEEGENYELKYSVIDEHKQTKITFVRFQIYHIIHRNMMVYTYAAFTIISWDGIKSFLIELFELEYSVLLDGRGQNSPPDSACTALSYDKTIYCLRA